MAPLHHHFELSGMPETQVVAMYYLVTAAAVPGVAAGLCGIIRHLRRVAACGHLDSFRIQRRREKSWRFKRRWFWAWRAAASPRRSCSCCAARRSVVCDTKKREAFATARWTSWKSGGAHLLLSEKHPEEHLARAGSAGASARASRLEHPADRKGARRWAWRSWARSSTPTASPRAFCWP